MISVVYKICLLILIFVFYSSHAVAVHFAEFLATTPFDSRQAVCTHNGNIVVISRADDHATVWISSNGKNWTQKTSNAGFSERTWTNCLSYDSKLWVFGGYQVSTSDEVNDVWYSSDDGANWTQATASAAWAKRHAHFSTVYDSKMWVAGGMDASFYNDVYYTTDGVTWTQADASAAWSARQQSGFFVFDSKLFVVGGYGAGGGVNDVWSSTDGDTWTQVETGADWSGRYGTLGFFVYDSKIWLAGGYSYGISDEYNDLWSSLDGDTWVQEEVSETWEASYFNYAVTLNNNVYMIGGTSESPSATYNDVWIYPNIQIIVLGSGGTLTLGAGGTITLQ